MDKTKERGTLHEHTWKVHWLFVIWDFLSSAINSLETGPQCWADHKMCSREEHGNEEEKTGLNNWLIICALSILPGPSSTLKFYF